MNRLEGYTGDGFNQRRAYIDSQNSMNLLSSKKELEEKKQQLNSNKVNLNNKNNTLNQMNHLMRNNMFKNR